MGNPFSVCLGQETWDVQDFGVDYLEKSAGGLDAVVVGQAEGMEDQAALLAWQDLRCLSQECAKEDLRGGQAPHWAC